VNVTLSDPMVTGIWIETLPDGRTVTAAEIKTDAGYVHVSKIDGESAWWLYAAYGAAGLPIFERGIGDRSLSAMEIGEDREIVQRLDAMLSRGEVTSG